MSVYHVAVSKDGHLVREWEVVCAAGTDPDNVLVDDNGTEEEVVWSEADSNAWFEVELADLLDRAAASA